MIKTIQHNNIDYPHFQSTGNAMRFALPFAQEVCEGYGIDIGCNRPEWAYRDKAGTLALMCDPAIGPECEAMKLPPGRFDYVVSSHSIEHYPSWVDALDHWHDKLKLGGVLFLYLPDYSQGYWRPWVNRKHVHIFTPTILKDYLTERGWNNIFVSGVDLNNSFIAMANK